MADISGYISDIAQGLTGADIRDPIVKALTELNEKGRDATKLNNQDESYFAKQADVGMILPADNFPRDKSKKVATSGGIFAVIGDLDDIDWGTDEWLI